MCFKTAPLRHSQNPRPPKSYIFPLRCSYHRCSYYRGDTRVGGDRAVQRPGSAPILICGRAAGRDRDGRDQTMSCIHRASANHRPAPLGPARRHRPPLGWRKTWPPGSHLRPSRGQAHRAPIASHPEEEARGGPRALGAGVAHKGRTHRPLRVELGSVPLRRAASRGREARPRPRRGGQRHPGYRRATTTTPRAALSARGMPG